MSRSDLLTEARDYANRRTGTVPGDLVLRLVIELEAVTAERDSAKRGAKTLGEIVVRHVEDMLRWAGMEDQIGVDDPDQQLAWERCAEMPGRITALEAERDEALAVIAEARALHYEHENTIHTIPATVCAHRYCVDGMGDQVAWPCPTGRILSRIPEHPKED